MEIPTTWVFNDIYLRNLIIVVESEWKVKDGTERNFLCLWLQMLQSNPKKGLPNFICYLYNQIYLRKMK